MHTIVPYPLTTAGAHQLITPPALWLSYAPLGQFRTLAPAPHLFLHKHIFYQAVRSVMQIVLHQIKIGPAQNLVDLSSVILPHGSSALFFFKIHKFILKYPFLIFFPMRMEHNRLHRFKMSARSPLS